MSSAPERVVPYGVRLSPALRRRQRHALASPRQPLRQSRFQPHRAQIAGRSPQLGPHFNDGLRIDRGPAGPLSRLWSGAWPVEQPNGVLAVIATDTHELIPDHLLLRPAALPISHVDRLQILSLRLLRHPSPLHEALHDGVCCVPEGKKNRCRNENLLSKILDGSIRRMVRVLCRGVY